MDESLIWLTPLSRSLRRPTLGWFASRLHRSILPQCRLKINAARALKEFAGERTLKHNGLYDRNLTACSFVNKCCRLVYSFSQNKAYNSLKARRFLGSSYDLQFDGELNLIHNVIRRL